MDIGGGGHDLDIWTTMASIKPGARNLFKDQSEEDLHGSHLSIRLSTPTHLPGPVGSDLPAENLTRLMPQCVMLQEGLSTWHSPLPLESCGQRWNIHSRPRASQSVSSLLFSEAEPVCLGESQGLWALVQCAHK